MKRFILLLIILLSVQSDLIAQTKRIRGRILDEKGLGMPGAGVSVKGTSIGTATDVDGNFQLDVPQDATTLVVQSVGYTTMDVPITSGTIVARLQPAAKELTGTVVTALGIKKAKKSLGYTQSDVSSEAIQKSGDQNVVEALAAKSPGIQVTGSGGTPGASSKVVFRGQSSFGDNQPLFVIDGVPVDNSTNQPVAGDYPFNQNLSGVNESNRGIDINPDDIESVSILRGPAASALYGARGGKGAIIITTKRGKYGKGKRLGITFNSTLGWDRVNKLPELQGNYLQGNNGRFSTFSPGPDGLILTGDDILGTPNSWGPRKDTTNIRTFNKYKNFFETGFTYANNLSIDGGSENAIFRLGVGNTKTTGVVPNTKFTRTNINLSGETKLSRWLTVGGVANYVNTKGQRAANGSTTGGLMLTYLRAPINYDVDQFFNPETNQQTMYYGVYDNPKFSANYNPYNDYTNRVYGNVYTSITINPDLILSWKIGTDFYNTQARQVFAYSSTADDNASGKGQMNITNLNNHLIYSDLILRYSKKLSERFELNSLLGYNVWDQSTKSFFQRGRQLAVPGFYNLGNFTELYASNTETYQQTQGVFAEATIGYNSFLYATITGRNDWTTAFGRYGRSIFYPKADIAWVFSEHIPRNNILTYGKIRAAYSDAGLGPSPYTYSRITYFTQPFITDGYTNGNGFPYLGQNGYATSNVLYPGGLIPAHNEGKEIGLELRLFKNRVSFEGTIYQELSMDNIFQKPVAPSTGYQAEIVNAGDIRNRGLELALNIDIIKSRDIQWSFGGNFTKNRSQVLRLANGVDQVAFEEGFTDIGSYAIVGQPLGVFYGSAWERDANGNILVNENGQAIRNPINKIIGNPNPDWLMGVNSSFTFKGFNVSFLFDIRKGGDVWNGTYARLNRIGMSSESAERNHKFLIPGVYASGPKAGLPNADSVSALYYFQTFKGDGGNYAAENAIENGGWFRLRSVNVSYRFGFRDKNPKSAIDYLTIGFTGKNLWLITNYKGVDPETSLTGAGSNIGGWDYFNNPGTRSYLINLRVGF